MVRRFFSDRVSGLDNAAVMDRMATPMEALAWFNDASKRMAVINNSITREGDTIDGFNVVASVESALGGGVLLLSRDGALRDMASVHGSYRLVEETHAALIAIAETIEKALPDIGQDQPWQSPLGYPVTTRQAYLPEHV